ncbi:MAG: hypothetical protein H6R03_426 [Burkholderiaceae bacterium]|nr:hypothetical protein [Burkholderiaceae bacterium]
MTFRRKSLAALLAFLLGAFGAHRIYLGRPRWWLPLAVTALTVPLIVGVRNWYQTPAFFVLMLPVVAGFIEALVIALMPDEKFDARFNAAADRRNDSGWDAVLVAPTQRQRLGRGAGGHSHADGRRHHPDHGDRASVPDHLRGHRALIRTGPVAVRGGAA